MIKRICDSCGADMSFVRDDFELDLIAIDGASLKGKITYPKPHGPASEGPDYCRACMRLMLREACDAEEREKEDTPRVPRR